MFTDYSIVLHSLLLAKSKLAYVPSHRVPPNTIIMHEGCGGYSSMKGNENSSRNRKNGKDKTYQNFDPAKVGPSTSDCGFVLFDAAAF